MAANKLPTKLKGLVLVEPTVHSDSRGFFIETFREEQWQALGIDCKFVQDNHSRSTKGTLRGMHFQTKPGQAKLVRCARGEILDVVVDLRKDSPTYGQSESFQLSDQNGHQLFVPVGFAHGFCVTSEIADVTYKCSNYYDGSTEGGILFNDPALKIEWPALDFTLSDRDQTAPKLAEIAESLPF